MPKIAWPRPDMKPQRTINEATMISWISTNLARRSLLYSFIASALATPKIIYLIQVAALAFALAILWPITAIVQELSVFAAAALLRRSLESSIIQWFVETIDFDRVYAAVAIQMASQVNVLGVSVVGSVGDLLHHLFPNVFLEPYLVADGAWVSAVIQSGSPLLARLLIKMSVAYIFAVAGLSLFYLALRRAGRMKDYTLLPAANGAAFLLGTTLQVRAIASVLSVPLTIADLQSMGLPEIWTKLAPSSQEAYTAIVAGIEPAMIALGSLWLLFLVYALSLASISLAKLMAGGARALRSFVAQPRSQHDADLNFTRSIVNYHATGVGPSMYIAAPLYVSAVIAVILLSLANAAVAKTNYDYLVDASDFSATATTTDTPAEASTNTSPRDATPTVVSISGKNYKYVYTVNGRREQIRGVGYNAQYMSLPLEERIAAYTRDFKAMKAVGINTILGWDHNSFDEITLALAHANGLGVVLPYHLSPEADYSNPAIIKELKWRVIDWVRRFKDSPALRMWGIGNEVIHGMRSKEQRKAFAEFYRDLADSVHEIDPNHPIVYRDAEDVFIPIIGKALVRERAERPWLVYGMNIFTYRLKDILAKWQQAAIDVPLIVSEFAPIGLQPRDRPAGYLKMWGILREHSNIVLGGFMYVWTTAGPEPLDRVYGLVDERGRPVDGSLEAMGRQFISEESSAGQNSD